MGQEVSRTFRGRCRRRLSKKEVRTWSRKKAFSGQRGAWRRMKPRMSLGVEDPTEKWVRSLTTDPHTHTILCTLSGHPSAHRRIVCAAHFLLAAFLRPSVPRHHDWIQMAAQTTDSRSLSLHHGGPPEHQTLPFLKTPVSPHLIASPGGISAANESPSRQPGSSWLWLGKKVNWPELKGTSWGPGCQRLLSGMNEGVVELATE